MSVGGRSLTPEPEPLLEEADEEIDVGEHCAWWVIIGGYSTQRSSCVHLPDAIRAGEANDPDEEPPADTLCYISRRKKTTWKTKSHTVMPIDYRPVCGHCLKALEEIVDGD